MQLVLVHVVIPKGLIEGLYNNIHQALPMIWLWSTGIINEVFTDFVWACIAYIDSPIQYDEWTLKHDFQRAFWILMIRCCAILVCLV